MAPVVSYRWHPLTDLPVEGRSLVSLSFDERAAARGLEERRRTLAFKGFLARLSRRWSIETGQIEGLYNLDRGTTELLIERGIESSIIPYSPAGPSAEEIVDILRDHENTLEGIFDAVASRRPLTTSYIRQVHQELCRHQDTVDGRNAMGQRTRRPLSKGAWKLEPNNPQRADGSVHEYCPPEHVAAEMGHLVALHAEHDARGVSPIVEAAWLHHRFTQVHPFEDGNGRVARVLASLVLIRAGLFPFVVERDQRGAYLDALESADRTDDVSMLADMMAAQQTAVLDAIPAP